MKNNHEVADVFRLYGKDYQKQNFLSCKEQKTMHHITACRTAKLGGHIEKCNQCDFERISYNSCRDRHCPKCQSMVLVRRNRPIVFCILTRNDDKTLI